MHVFSQIEIDNFNTTQRLIQNLVEGGGSGTDMTLTNEKIELMRNGLHGDIAYSNFNLKEINEGQLIAIDNEKLYKLEVRKLLNGASKLTFKGLSIASGTPSETGEVITDVSLCMCMSISSNILKIKTQLGTYYLNHTNIETYDTNAFSSNTNSAIELLDYISHRCF